MNNKKIPDFAVVAIGASAGGIEAIREVLKNLPSDTGFAYVYIQHLNPDQDSKLDEILSRATKMPVLEAKNNMALKPDHLFIIPPNRDIFIQDGNLTLSSRPIRPLIHLPINLFFNSLAENYKEKSIGILLSGNAPDGTLGLKSIKAAGGICFAQDNSAQFQGMPKNAVAEEAVDLILSPRQIAEELVKFSQHQQSYHKALLSTSEEGINDQDEDLLTILKMIHRLTGVDLSHYKNNTIKRRILRRMIIHKMENLSGYVSFLKSRPNEVQQLYQDLLIHVTSFFRDAASADYLRKTLLPKIMREKAAGDGVRVWIPACSTGQEAYTLAILLMEVLGEKAATTSVQVFATDLSELSINKARLGIYSRDEVVDVPPRMLEKYFNLIDGSFRIIKSIRDLCIFATHNVLKDPPFSRLDLISCSNLMIYLQPVLQKKLLATFHYSLNSTGYLVLGNSETIGNSSALFTQVDKKLKVFSIKKDGTTKAIYEMSYGRFESKPVTSDKKTAAIKTKSEDLDLDKAVEDLLLKKYTPACVVVTNDLNIVQFKGSTGLFLEPSPGKASLNLLKMARPALAIELRSIVLKASRSGTAEKKTWEETTEGKPNKKISIEAIPVSANSDQLDRYYLVIFEEEVLGTTENSKPVAGKDKRVKQLEEELVTIREDMHTMVEALETANEELQSVNEEIVSSNEELQSINEELETSKEELESSNEELITINQELQMRNERLAEVYEYSEAVFSTVRESLLILDKNLKVKTANSSFYKTFGVTEEETEGKLLYDIGNRQWDIPKLKELLEEVIPRNFQIIDFEITHSFPGIGEKTMLLNARRLVRKLHSEHFILLAFEDITRFRQSEKIIRDREEWFRNTADNAPIMIWVTDLARKNQFVNKSWLEYRNMSLEEALTMNFIEDNIHPDDRERVTRIFDDSFEKRKAFHVRYRLEKDGKYEMILSQGKPNYSLDKVFTGFIGSCVEIPGGL